MDRNLFSFKMNPEQKKLWGLFQFLARLSILSVPLYLILEFGVSLYQLQLAVADHMYWLFTAWGFPITREGILFTLAGDTPFSFIIGEDCIAWKSLLFFFALVIAVPRISWKKRLVGIAVGFPLIWIGNLLRIFGIVWVQQAYGTVTALFLHDVGWQLGLVSLVLVLWVGWLWLSKGQKIHLKD